MTRMAGEKEIARVLEELGAKYEKKPKIPLNADEKKYRQPDFYLPDYKMYIEYFSTWDASFLQERERKKCIEKQQAYSANGINCLYIYPKDLWNVKQLITDALTQVSVLGTKKAVNSITKKIKKREIDLIDVARKSEKEVFLPSKKTVEEKQRAPSGIIETFGGAAIIIIGIEVVAILLLIIYIFFFR